MIDRRLAHFRITSHLGSGGMGDVYRATDTKLGRDVALKLLPESVAHDRNRAARFQREARALAALNHPLIAAIHGLEEVDGQRFLVMELVPGQTLAERIARGRLPLEEAVGIARQIAEALEAAHEKDIVHRDLKPANVKVTPDGRVKVLDFGLAKLGADEADSVASPLSSPTLSARGTAAGVVLGTVPYMAPEQAKGMPVDRRTDIFALGCILYEMLAGRRPFEGGSVAETLGHILQSEPDWGTLPARVPPSVHRLLRLCLQKDPQRRRQAAGDVRVDLELALAETEAPKPLPTPVRRARWALTAAATGVLGLVGALAVPLVRHFREAPPSELRLDLVTPSTFLPLHFALSPDGGQIAFVASDPSANGVERLFVRALDRRGERALAGTEWASLPFWSPDGRSIGFFASGQLQRIDLTGGAPRALAPAQIPLGGSWSDDGTILFAPNSVSPLLRVPASGGEAVAATGLDAPRQTSHRLPCFLPDGRRFLFYAVGEASVAGLFLGSLDGAIPKRLGEADTAAQYLAPQHVAFVQQGALVARRLDLARGELVGDPTTLTSAVSSEPFSNRGGFSAAASGAVAHRAGRPLRPRLAWFDRSGAMTDIGEGAYAPELSPDGRSVAFDRTVDGNRDVWIMELARGALTRFTHHPAVDGLPVWSPDGSRIAFESTRNGTFDIWTRASSGAGEDELLFEAPDSEWPLDWSQDGQYLLIQRSDLRARADILALPLTGADRTPVAVADTAYLERLGVLSPNGRWVAYATNESGRFEVVAQTFPRANGRVAVSTEGGDAPRWRADGKEIFYLAVDGTTMAVSVTTTATTLEAGMPTAVAPMRILPVVFKAQYSVAADGRFLANTTAGAQPDTSPIELILNWRP